MVDELVWLGGFTQLKFVKPVRMFLPKLAFTNSISNCSPTALQLISNLSVESPKHLQIRFHCHSQKASPSIQLTFGALIQLTFGALVTSGTLTKMAVVDHDNHGQLSQKQVQAMWSEK